MLTAIGSPRIPSRANSAAFSRTGPGAGKQDRIHQVCGGNTKLRTSTRNRARIRRVGWRARASWRRSWRAPHTDGHLFADHLMDFTVDRTKRSLVPGSPLGGWSDHAVGWTTVHSLAAAPRPIEALTEAPLSSHTATVQEALSRHRLSDLPS